MPKSTTFFSRVKDHLTIHTNNLGYRVKTYACHLAIYTNNLTFWRKSCYRSLINNDQYRITLEAEEYVYIADRSINPPNGWGTRYRPVR